VADKKNRLRTILRSCRSGLDSAYVADISRRVQTRLIDDAAYRTATSLVLYSPKDHEIETGLILADSLSGDRPVMFPKIDGPGLALIRVRTREELKPGRFDLLEPDGSEIVPVEALAGALVCIPGLGFSPMGQRLGRGGGYYDRLLSELPSAAITAGLAYSFQLLDRLPESPNDRRLQLIFTESATYRPSQLSGESPSRTAEGGILS
jgi:5-formyltetrahydrofolate cyclo-ligase